MSRIRNGISSLGLAVVVLTNSAVAPAWSAEPRQHTNTVYSITDQLARTIARHVPVPSLASPKVDLASLAKGDRLSRAVAEANREVLAAKGLPAAAGSVLRIRLAAPNMRASLARGVTPVIAASPTDDTATSVAAYELGGKAVTLDPVRVPERPVFLVEVDVAKAMRWGLRHVRQVLAERQVGASKTNPAGTSAASGYWATKVNAVRLDDDEEPWFKGGAEVYAIAGGFGLDGKATVDIVQMPYLNHDGTTYYPNQLVVHFSAYKYNLADVVMMEDDGDTNYQQLAIAIANALLVIVDGGAYAPLVNAILNAIPGSWWTDDPDYVDSWYTLATYSSGRLNGAAGNGWIDVSPYWVAPL